MSNPKDLLEEMFGMDPVEIEIIPVDEEQQYQQQILPLYARLHRIEKPTVDAVVEETIASVKEADNLSYICVKSETSEQFRCPVEEIKYTTEVVINGEKYQVVSPRKEYLVEWKVKLSKYLTHLQTQIEDFVEFLPTLTEWMDSVHKSVIEYAFKTPNKQRLEVQRLILLVQLYEKKMFKQVSVLAEKFACTEMQIDPSSDGAWLTTGQRASGAEIRAQPSLVIPLKRKLRYDSRTVNLICQMKFSKKPEIRGAAKLDLNSRLDKKQMQQLLQNSDDMLAIALAEAKLSPDEVLAVVFPKVDQKETQCIACEKAINLHSTIYHRKCQIVEWLITYQPFKFDEVESCIVPIKRMYIDPDQRRKVSTILTLYSHLYRDIVVKTATETTVWRRDEDGIPRRTNLVQRKEEDVIGSQAWKQKHGFSPQRNKRS